MASTRMAPGAYKKKLIRIPPDVLEMLEEEARKQERSFNGQLIYALRKHLHSLREEDATPTPALAAV